MFTILGTFALMGEFYTHLNESNETIKAEALQKAQVALIHGEVGSELLKENSSAAIASSLKILQNSDFTHPYYWSGFTLIGSHGDFNE
jgi:CHAT domain-containing protein